VLTRPLLSTLRRVLLLRVLSVPGHRQLLRAIG
jgi:hypothetical protein